MRSRVHSLAIRLLLLVFDAFLFLFKALDRIAGWL